jgi:hypothetical protein
MLAKHLGVDGWRRHTELTPDHLAQARGVQHGAGAQHTLGRQAAGLQHHARQHVNRVGEHHDGSAEAGQLAPDGRDKVGVVLQQGQPGFTGAAATAGRHQHHDVGTARLVDGGGTHLSIGAKGGPMPQVHRVAFGDGAVDVVQPQLVGHTGMQGRDGHAGAHPPGANDAHGSVHAAPFMRIGDRRDADALPTMATA